MVGLMRARRRIEGGISKEGVASIEFPHLVDPYKFAIALDQIYFCYLFVISHVFN